MSRRYPAMRERPPGFRINPASPLYGGLVFAGLGGFERSARFQDFSSRGQHGVLTNMDPPTDWVWMPQLRRWGMDFDGVDDIVDCGIVLDNPRAITLSCWFYCRANPDAGVGMMTRFYWVPSCLYGMGVDPGPDLWGYIGTGEGFDSAYLYRPGGGVVTNQWEHYAFTWDGSTMRLWVNGVELGTGKTNTVTPGSNTISLVLGRSGTTHTGYGYISGIGADFCIWSRALRSHELAELANPNNVDLRLGGVPLILPPRRRLWPVVFEGVPTGKVPWHLFQTVAS